MESQVTAALRQQFRPEFLNRVDDIIIFRPLGADQIGHIVGLQLARMDRLLADRKIALQLSDEAKALIAAEGYDPAFGARPLKRAIQRLVQNPLALELLEGKFHDGDTIVATVQGGALKFESAA